MRFSSNNPLDTAAKKLKSLNKNGFQTFSQRPSPCRLEAHFQSVQIPEKRIARNESVTSLNTVQKPSKKSHARSVCDINNSFDKENIEAPKSKSKERPFIPKLNLDSTYLETKFNERELLERQMMEEDHKEDEHVLSNQFVIGG